jgi:hypothetical protein
MLPDRPNGNEKPLFGYLEEVCVVINTGLKAFQRGTLKLAIF